MLIYFWVVSWSNGNDVNDYVEQWSLSGEWVKRLLVFIVLWVMMRFIDVIPRMAFG